ncbi:unnamed protein product [Ceutorhynchus assimilis]|uniref:Uncharacterized protein n=1 Tax=Ceutorhynchus assimilis TaxID=467358 RepID=A0A9N9MNJ7_9CUCU|nr:unnamed protein product [Ceutorhynchus assimilis]CAG9768340.1 unnamed protein product [Ceutorhynchus assimilis]
MDALRKRQRFTDHDDLVLLREVLSHNPFENPALWHVIQENVSSLTGKTFVIRTLREHLERLIKLWLEMFKILKDKSGIEVVSTEKDTLCSNIYDLMKEFKDSKKKKTSVSASKTIGIDARNQWTQLLEASGSSVKTENIGSESLIHDHGSLTIPVEDILSDDVRIEFVDEVDLSMQDTTECIENTEPIMNEASTSSAYLSTHKVNVLDPQTSHQTDNTVASNPEIKPSTSSSKPAKILGPVRSRKRKANTQRQGLAYLENYDKQQSDIKKKQLELEERKLKVEERMMDLLEKQHDLTEFQIKKQFELIEKKNNLESQNQQNLLAMAERQDKLINLLINKIG